MIKLKELDSYPSHRTEYGLYVNGENVEVMKKIPSNYFDIAIVDPPYGIGEDGAKNHSRGAKVGFKGAKRQAKAESKKYTAKNWDKEIPSLEYFQELKRVSKNQIIFGGNYYQSLIEDGEKYVFVKGEPVYEKKVVLGATSCWIVWDKKNDGNDFADFEMAWTSFNSACRFVRFKWNGMLQEDMKNKEVRIHPTQKPVHIYRQILQKFGTKGMKILDTNVGSASSLIACITEGFYYLGIEMDEEYFEKSSNRVENAKYGIHSTVKDNGEAKLHKHGHQSNLF